MEELRNSKYCMFTVMSYVDYSHIVNEKIIAKLDKRFRTYSHDRCEDAQSMLVKETVIFQINTNESVRQIAQLNLLHYRFGLNV